MSRLRYIGNSSEAEETKNFIKDFIERLKFVGSATEKEMDKIASEMHRKQ